MEIYWLWGFIEDMEARIMTSAIRLERLRCQEPQDSLTDEVMIQVNGRQVWPPSGSFSLNRETEVGLNVQEVYEGQVDVTLFDHEDIGTDDNMGGVLIPEGDTNGSRTTEITGDGSLYILTYRTKSLSF
ncbi:hypothetical protein ACFZAD_35815 [Streptomyces iakyrus]|uniref:hypothetical protein n=1 Tax=Streptomyces iakyrus TaxID=68219 RepID=UPI0036ED1D8E